MPETLLLLIKQREMEFKGADYALAWEALGRMDASDLDLIREHEIFKAFATKTGKLREFEGTPGTFFSLEDCATILLSVSKFHATHEDDHLHAVEGGIVGEPIIINIIAGMPISWVCQLGPFHAISACAYAVTLLKFETPQFFDKIPMNSANMRMLARDGTAQEIGNCCYAYYTANVNARKFFSEINSQGERLARDGDPQDVANISSCLKKFKVKAPLFFAAVEMKVQEGLDEGVGVQILEAALPMAHQRRVIAGRDF